MVGAKVSVIIPFYNCPYVIEALDSVLNQTYDNIEIILVNDGSTIHQEKINPYLSKINYIEKANGGTGSALNAGMEVATGDYFAWLSSDDMFRPEKIEKQLRCMEENQSFISYTNYSLINELSEILHENVGIHYEDRNVFLRHFQKGCHINGCTIMFKKEVYHTIGAFNEKYKYTQDYEYWLRIIQQHDFTYLNESLTLYRVHPDMGSKKHGRAQMAEIHELRTKYKRILRELERGELG